MQGEAVRLDDTLRLDDTVRIAVLEPLEQVNNALLNLLKGLEADDWARPTVHPGRTVKDLTAHLLQGSLGRVSALRDRYLPPGPKVASLEELIAWIQERNREFMTAMRRVSPEILIEMIEVYDQELLSAFSKLDPDGDSLGVAWAGEQVSRCWFDVAREYTEKWHHQQQLRDATGRPGLDEESLLRPALETFARGLPFAYRAVPAEPGARVAVRLTGADRLEWTLRRDKGGWSLWSGVDPQAETSITMSADLAWRVWTRGVLPEEAIARMVIRGDAHLAPPLAAFVAIMA